ncbi:MAG: AAA family ATPase [Acidimicrobiales bacterium]
MLVLIGAFLGSLELTRPHVTGDPLRIDTYVNYINDGRVRSATILDEDSYAVGTYVRDDKSLGHYRVPLTATSQTYVVFMILVPSNVPTVVNQQVAKKVARVAGYLLPGLILILLFGYLIISYRRGSGLFSIRSGARKSERDDSGVTFADVAGQDEAVNELLEIKEFLTDPARFTEVGAAVPKGILLYGPPGCGKTMLARALAGEAQASFYSISGSDFVEVYVGVGASRVRDLFREAREHAPAIVFIDELDSVGRSRGQSGATTSHPEQEQALNQILTEMDGFSPSEGIILLGATNRPDVLDPALLRPGRFDRAIGLATPDEDARLAILNVHARDKALSPSVDLGLVAAASPGMTGADLANVMNEAALLTARAGRTAIAQPEVTQALARVREAPERQRRLALRSRSIGRRFTAEERVSFADVAGQAAAVAELEEIKTFLVDPERYTGLGANVPKGVLLYGPPGCGKTLLAKALAGETNAAFLSVAASEFVEILTGLGASRVRDLFAEARATPPAIIFIDELDAIGGSRIAGPQTGRPRNEEEQTLNQLLTEMDGFSAARGVLVLAATNRPDALDPALLRPGRFDRSVGLELPDEEGRRAILEIHARGTVLGPDADLGAIAAKAYGLTGADLANVINEAALLAGREEREGIAGSDLSEALSRLMGAPARQRRLSMRARSVGRRYSAVDDRVTFADVAGAGDAIAELAEVRDYLTDPARFHDLGARVPRGILLAGPPGCGKTLLARAVAGEANAAFLSASATDFVEVWVGLGASRVRDLFAEARSTTPAIVFLDEIDAVGARRGGWNDHAERESTLNQLLVEMDGFEGRQAVIVIGATNRPDVLDAALVRPGRFDRQITISLPDRAGRRAILGLYAAAKALAPDVDLDAIASLTPGMSGADLENVVNEAILLTARARLAAVPMALMEEGIDRAGDGVGSHTTIMSPEERRIVAYHEAGHGLVANQLPGALTFHKLTIIPRGGSLGRCTLIDDDERMVVSQSTLVDRMAGLLGGWAAEQVVFGEVCSGGASDLDRVGYIARRMVRSYGMSEEMGPLGYDDQAEGRSPSYSEDSARSIDREVRRLVDQAHQRAREVLTGSRHVLDRVAAELLEHETIDADRLAALTAKPDEAHAQRW